MRRCARCILSELFQELEFDADGVCSVCRAPGRAPRPPVDYAANRRELEALLARDGTCVLGFSGGKDSIYALHLLRRELGARPVLVNFDNGWQTPSSREAMETCARHYGVELVVLRPRPDEYDALLRTLFLSTGEVCLPCDLEIYAGLLREAERRGVGLVVMGGGASEGLTQVTRHRAVDVWEYAKGFLQGAAEVDLDRLAVAPADFERVRLVQMGDCFVWDHARILATIQEELRLAFPGVEDGTYMHNDCRLCRLQDHVRFVKRGYGRNEPLLAALVRSGTMSRDEALRRAEQDAAQAAREPEALEAFCRRIGLDRERFYAVVEDPAVVYSPPWYHRRAP